MLPDRNILEPSLYKPISLLQLLSKMLDKIFLVRIKETINRKQLIPDHQFGFRDKHVYTIE